MVRMQLSIAVNLYLRKVIQPNARKIYMSHGNVFCLTLNMIHAFSQKKLGNSGKGKGLYFKFSTQLLVTMCFAKNHYIPYMCI